jgi:hypothetical protein
MKLVLITRQIAVVLFSGVEMIKRPPGLRTLYFLKHFPMLVCVLSVSKLTTTSNDYSQRVYLQFFPQQNLDYLLYIF